MLPLPQHCRLAVLRPADCAVVAEWLAATVDGDWNEATLQRQPGDGSQRWVLEGEVANARVVPGFVEVRQVLDEAEVFALAIAPAWQGRGLGRILLRQVLDQLRGQQCRRCLLEVRRSNVRAQALYLSAGFVLDGIRKNYYPPVAGSVQEEDALLYSRLLLSSSD